MTFSVRFYNYNDMRTFYGLLTQAKDLMNATNASGIELHESFIYIKLDYDDDTRCSLAISKIHDLGMKITKVENKGSSHFIEVEV